MKMPNLLAPNLLTLNLTVAGVLLVGLGALHIALPAALNWHRELAGASPINREVSYVHCYFIGLTCVLWGLLALAAGRQLDARCADPLGEIECLVQRQPLDRVGEQSELHGVSFRPTG